MNTQTPLSGAGSGWTYTRWGYPIERFIRQFRSRRLASLSTVLVLGVTLTLPFLLFFANATLQTVAGKSLEGESITVFLTPDVSDLQAATLANEWMENADIRSTQLISSDEALKQLENSSDLQGVIETLGSNPLPAAVVLFPESDARNEAHLRELAETLQSVNGVDRVQIDLQWVHRLQAIVALIKWIAGLLAVFLIMTALLVIANTIRLELARRHAELEVAQLLGASSGFVNRPILVTGAIYGLLGGLIACVMALSSLLAIQFAVDDLTRLYPGEWLLIMPTASHILIVLGISVVLGLAGAISSLARSSQELTHSQSMIR